MATKKAAKSTKASKSKQTGTKSAKSTKDTKAASKATKKPEVVAPARNEALEAAIRAERSDATVSVYADWLQGQGNPAGELIVLEQQLARKNDSKKRKRANELAAQLQLPPAGTGLLTYTVEHGLWSMIRLENSDDWMNAEFDVAKTYGPVLASPMCCALQQLRIGVMRWEYNKEDVPAAIALAGKQPWAKHLRELYLGDVDEHVDLAHHAVGVVGKAITKAFPNLELLHVHSSEQTWDGKDTFSLAGLDLPKLHTLTVETCSMSKKRLAEILDAKLPSLTSLELWFGDSENGGADAKYNQLMPLLDGKLFPKVTSLGLRNCEFTDLLPSALATSSIAKRLVSLDLSMGIMIDNGATILAKSRAKYPKLKHLDIEQNYVGEEACRLVEEAFAGIEVLTDDQQEAEVYEGAEYRTVSIVE